MDVVQTPQSPGWSMSANGWEKVLTIERWSHGEGGGGQLFYILSGDRTQPAPLRIVKWNEKNEIIVHCLTLQFLFVFSSFFFSVQNSTSSTDNSEMESLKKECEMAKKKCKEAQEKYFSESDRLKAIIDERQGMTLLALFVDTFPKLGNRN